MQKKCNILICVLISLIFFCGLANAVTSVRCGENGMMCPGQPSICSDRFEIKNTTVFALEAGKEQDIQIDFIRHFCFYDYGTGNVSYSISDTPLNVTVPSGFIATPASMVYPGVIRIRADSRLPPANYSFTLHVNGAKGTSTFSEIFFVNVKPNKEFPFSLQQSPLPIILPVLAIITIFVCCRWTDRRKK